MPIGGQYCVLIDNLTVRAKDGIWLRLTPRNPPLEQDKVER